MTALNNEAWTVVYSGKVTDVVGILDEQGRNVYQTIGKTDGVLSGWRYGDNLAQATKAANGQ
jgi:hypothetical protein